jgi:hypothetical protein
VEDLVPQAECLEAVEGLDITILFRLHSHWFLDREALADSWVAEQITEVAEVELEQQEAMGLPSMGLGREVLAFPIVSLVRLPTIVVVAEAG